MSEHEAKEERAHLVLLVAVPLIALWLLLLLAPASAPLSIAERVAFGSLCTFTYGPLMTLRIRDR